MKMDYWNALLTEKSWTILQEIKKKYEFVLIGGWAAYLWARRQKSKDIDIVVGINELQKLKSQGLIKNDNLKKYEIKRGDIDIDIYVPYYSKLAVPAEDIARYAVSIEGFKVVSKEILLILKQGAEFDRGDSVKGEKDKLDILSLLFFTDIDYRAYYSLLKNYKIEHYFTRLKKILMEFSDYQSFGLTPREFKLKKEEILKKLRSA